MDSGGRHYRCVQAPSGLLGDRGEVGGGTRGVLDGADRHVRSITSARTRRSSSARTTTLQGQQQTDRGVDVDDLVGRGWVAGLVRDGERARRRELVAWAARRPSGYRDAVPFKVAYEPQTGGSWAGVNSSAAACDLDRME